MRRVDAFLTRMAQAVWSAALVYCQVQPTKEIWSLEKNGPSQDGFSPEMLGLGSTFGEARAALAVIVKAECARTGVNFPVAQPGLEEGDDIILATQARLMKSALENGHFKKMSDELRISTKKRADKYLPGAEDKAHASILAMLDDIVNARVALRSTTAIFRKMLGLIYKWLPEEGQRQAQREMKALTLEDVNKNWN